MIFIQVCKKNSQSRLPYLWPTTDRSALNESNLSSPKQFGLISGRSTVTDILVNWGSRRCYYFDFAKVFDTVPHLRLFGKPISFVINRKIVGVIIVGLWVHHHNRFIAYDVFCRAPTATCHHHYCLRINVT